MFERVAVGPNWLTGPLGLARADAEAIARAEVRYRAIRLRMLAAWELLELDVYDDPDGDDLEYDNLFIFDELGWNFEPSELSAAFGLVQLGQAATSLGEGELAYHCLTHLVNRFWLNNLASMHNHRSLFNMDISGGMPAVIIKMLVASDVGRIQVLPALPAAWPSGPGTGSSCVTPTTSRSKP